MPAIIGSHVGTIDITRPHIERATNLLAGCVESGTAFFELAAEALAIGTGCKGALVCQLREDATTVSSLGFWNDGGLAAPISYNVASGPCAAIYGSDPSQRAPFIGSDVAAIFPACQLLRDLGAQSYRGLAFANAEETPVGHVVAIDDRPSEADPKIDAFLQLVAKRVEAEFRRWQAEMAPGAREVQLRAVINAWPGIAAIKSLEGRYIAANPALCRLLGAPEAEVLGRLAGDFLSPERAAQVEQEDQEVLAGGKAVTQEMNFEIEGETRSLQASKFPIFDANAELIALGRMATDITERNLYEAESKASQNLLNSLFEYLPFPVSLKDREGRIIQANRQFASLVNLPLSDLPGKCPEALFGAENARVVRESDQRILASGQGESYEWRYQDDAGTRTFLATRFPVRDAEGGTIGTCGLSVDITPRIQLAEERERSHQLLTAAVEALSEGFVIFDDEERLVLCNSRYREIYQDVDVELRPGITIEEIARRSARHFLGSDSPEEVEPWVAERLARFRRGSEPFEQQSNDGRWLKVSDLRMPNGWSVGVRTDITLRKQQEQALAESEARYRSLIELIPESVILHRDGKILFGNPTAVKALGAEELSDLVGYPVLDLIHPDERERVKARMERVMVAGESLVAKQREMIGLDGRRWVGENSAIRIELADGPAALVSIRDVTERLRLEEQLRRAQKLEAVGQLTGGIAHDFNNLLAIISGNAELLAESLPDNAKVEIILRSALRGAELTDHLLSFAGRQKLEPEALELGDFIEICTRLFDRTLGEHIRIESRIWPGCWQVYVDPGQFENALLNLALNARDAMPKGGTITISASNCRLDEDDSAFELSTGDYVEVAIADEGTGIPDDLLEHVVEPFFTTKPVGVGSGLGLSMVYGFARQSHGHLRIDSTADRGTRISLLLPRARVLRASETAAVDDRLAPKGKGEKILIIEDNDEVRKTIVAMLDVLNYDAIAVATAAEFETHDLTTEGFDLVIADIILPEGVSGFDLAERIEKQNPGLPILFISGYIGEGQFGDKMAGRHILPKPFKQSELATSIRRVLGRS